MAEMGGVALGYCHPAEVSAYFHECVVSMYRYDVQNKNHLTAHISLTCGPRIASGRNELVSAFMRHPDEPEWLFMVDADMTFQCDIIDAFLEYADPVERPVVGGLCFGGGVGGKIFPTLYRLLKDDSGTVQVERLETWPERKLVKVDGTGTAALMIHRSVFSRMWEVFGKTAFPWFSEGELQGREVGEDIMFCLRLNSLGIPVHVATDIELGHVKPYIIDSSDYKRWKWLRDKHGPEAASEAYMKKLRLGPGVASNGR